MSTFDQVADQLGLPKAEVNDPDGKMIGHWWRRHPLAFLMEAADDICYNVMDLEEMPIYRATSAFDRGHKPA